MPACRYRLQGCAVRSFLDRSALHSRLHTPPPPRGGSGSRDSRRARWSSASVPRVGIILKHPRGWSPPVRLRYTRNTGRAQQRSTGTATGSSVVGLRTHPEPNHQSAFSSHVSRIPVKAYRRLITRQSDLDQKTSASRPIVGLHLPSDPAVFPLKPDTQVPHTFAISLKTSPSVLPELLSTWKL